MPRGSRSSPPPPELVELTASEIAVESLREKIAEFGGEGRALIYAVRMGKKVRRGDANATELLKDPEKYLGEHFGGEDYKVDFMTSGGDWAQRGVEFYVDVATYGPPKTLSTPSGGAAAGLGLSPDVAALKDAVSALVAKVDALARPARDPLDDALKLVDRMAALKAPGAGSSDPMQILSMEVLRRGLSGMEKVANGTGSVTPVEQIGIDAAKEFMPLIRQYLELQLHGPHRKAPGENARGNGSQGSVDMLKKELLPQAATHLLILAQAKKEPKDGAVLILKSIPREYDSALHAIVKGPVVDELVLINPALGEFRDWVAEVQRLLVAEFEDENAPALVPEG